MEKAWMLLVLASAIVAGTCNAQVNDDAKVVHIRGKVMCQDCSKGWEEWMHGAAPLKDVKVAVTCMDWRGRVVHYGTDITDEQGTFQLVIERNINGKPLMVERCTVKLVSSPHQNCNVPTDFAGGKSGMHLMVPTLIYQDLVEYTVGPFYYTSPMCELPEMYFPTGDFNDDDDDDKGSH